MDQKEHQLPILDICKRLYNFFTKTLAKHALKTLKFGRPLHQNVAEVGNRAPYENNQIVQPRAQEETPCEGVDQSYNANNSDPFVSLGSSTDDLQQHDMKLPEAQDNVSQEKSREEEAPLPSLEAKPPKKAVSINDRIEEINTSKKRIRRKKSKENLPSFEQQDEEPKPLRSILKVGSISGEKSIYFVNRSSDG